MRRAFLLILLFGLSAGVTFAGELDPLYLKTYGSGVVLVSGKDYPPYDKCDPSLVDFKKPISYLPVGTTKFDLRVIWPKGQDAAKMMAKLKAARPQNIKYQDGYDQVFFDFWVSHNDDGTPVPEAANWPSKVSERPKEDPKHEAYLPLPDDPTTAGIKWMDLSSGFFSWLPAAQPGWKIYVAVSVGFKYQVGAGQTETKWNSNKNIFEKVISSGELSYEKSDPIVVGYIEIK